MLASNLTHVPSDKQFVTEMSDLMAKDRSIVRGVTPGTIEVQSHRTHVTITFEYERTVRDEEGDAVLWIYMIARESVRRVPSMAGYTLHVLND